MLTLLPKCLSEHEKNESENLFNVSLMLFSLLFRYNDEDNEFNRSLKLEILFLKSSTLSLSHFSFLTYVVSLLGVLVHAICLECSPKYNPTRSENSVISQISK